MTILSTYGKTLLCWSFLAYVVCAQPVSTTLERRRRLVAKNAFWTMPQVVNVETELEAKRALLEGFLFGDSWSMSYSMPLPVTPSPSSTPMTAVPTLVVSDGSSNDNTDGNSPTAAPSVDQGILVLDEPTNAPINGTSNSDPSEATFPDDSSGSNGGRNGIGLAWIAVGTLALAAGVMTSLWIAKHRRAANAAAMGGACGGLATDDSGSADSSNDLNLPPEV